MSMTKNGRLELAIPAGLVLAAIYHNHTVIVPDHVYLGTR
jgi:hypothetical protein